MLTKELLLKTAFCCMACDGEIANEEVLLVKKLTSESQVFDGLDVEACINSYIKGINEKGMAFLNDYIAEVEAAQLSDEDAISLIDVAIKTIEADKNIVYSEISFFKRIRKRLPVSDEKVIACFPGQDIEEYLLPDVEVVDNNWEVSFDTVNFNDI